MNKVYEVLRERILNIEPDAIRYLETNSPAMRPAKVLAFWIADRQLYAGYGDYSGAIDIYEGFKLLMFATDALNRTYEGSQITWRL